GVLRDLIQEVVLRLLDGGLAVLRRARERVAQVPAVDAQVVVDAAGLRRQRAGAALTVVLDLVHRRAQRESRRRQLPPVQLVAERSLEAPDDELDVDGQAAGAAVARVTELL